MARTRMDVQARGRRPRRRRALFAAPVLTMLAVACQPTPPLLSPSAKVGNAVGACAQFQAVPAAPCGPQPGYWSAINGPYEIHANGDPYATKCSTGVTGAACDVPGNPNGAANPEYRASGYTYAIDVAPADIGVPITLQAWDIGQFARTITPNGVAVPESAANQALRDCDRGVAPFTTAAYFGASPTAWRSGFGPSQCQTGEMGTKLQNIDVQLFDNDGSDTTVQKRAPLPACHFRLLTSDPGYDATKNTWTNLCTFTPAQAGIYPFEVRNSGLAGVPDLPTMTGRNAFSLRLTGATTSGLRPVGDASVWVNDIGARHRLYLAEVTPAQRGKKLIVDLFDIGDGFGPAESAVQLQGPSSGAPAPVPTGGTIVPAPGLASACAYNPTPSLTRGPATPEMAANCRVITTVADTGTSTYNDRWLRLEVQLDPAYTCGTEPGTDCWWTLEHNFGFATFPSDHTVFRVTIA